MIRYIGPGSIKTGTIHALSATAPMSRKTINHCLIAMTPHSAKSQLDARGVTVPLRNTSSGLRVINHRRHRHGRTIWINEQRGILPTGLSLNEQTAMTTINRSWFALDAIHGEVI